VQPGITVESTVNTFYSSPRFRFPGMESDEPIYLTNKTLLVGSTAPYHCGTVTRHLTRTSGHLDQLNTRMETQRRERPCKLK